MTAADPERSLPSSRVDAAAGAARVARYAEAMRRADDEALVGTNFGRLTATYDEAARAVMAVADEEQAELRAENERLRRGGKELGRILDRSLRDALDASGRHDVIGEDGDGDWAVVWETLSGLRPRAEAAEREVERLRGLGVEWMNRYNDVLEVGRETLVQVELAQAVAADRKARLDALVADLRGLADEWSTGAVAFWAGSSADVAPAIVLSNVVAKVAAVLDKHAGEQAPRAVVPHVHTRKRWHTGRRRSLLAWLGGWFR